MGEQEAVFHPQLSDQIRGGSNYEEALRCKGASLVGLVLYLKQFTLAIGDEEAIYYSGAVFKGLFSPQLDLDRPLLKLDENSHT